MFEYRCDAGSDIERTVCNEVLKDGFCTWIDSPLAESQQIKTSSRPKKRKRGGIEVVVVVPANEKWKDGGQIDSSNVLMHKRQRRQIVY